MKDILDSNNLLYLNNMLKQDDIYGIGGELIKIMCPEMPFIEFMKIIDAFGLKLKLVPLKETNEDKDKSVSIAPTGSLRKMKNKK